MKQCCSKFRLTGEFHTVAWLLKKPLSQSCTVAKSENFWQPLGNQAWYTKDWLQQKLSKFGFHTHATALWPVEQSSILFTKSYCPVACCNFSLFTTAHDCETDLVHFPVLTPWTVTQTRSCWTKDMSQLQTSTQVNTGFWLEFNLHFVWSLLTWTCISFSQRMVSTSFFEAADKNAYHIIKYQKENKSPVRTTTHLTNKQNRQSQYQSAFCDRSRLLCSLCALKMEEQALLWQMALARTSTEYEEQVSKLMTVEIIGKRTEHQQLYCLYTSQETCLFVCFVSVW